MLPQVYENVTDAKQYEILEMSRISGFVDRARGTGRPTKKDRRSLEAFIEPAMFGFYEDIGGTALDKYIHSSVATKAIKM